MKSETYQSADQINGTAAHQHVDEGTYSDKCSILMGMDVFCERYGLIGKIDIYDAENKVLRERKKKIKQVYDGYIFQLYAQYFSLIEMGYDVAKIELYSMDDHKTYTVEIPKDNPEMLNKFESTIYDIQNFQIGEYIQNNAEKCKHCIYEPACDRSLIAE